MKTPLSFTIILWSILLVACNNNANNGKRTPKAAITDTLPLRPYLANAIYDDSVALLQLTQKLYRWIGQEDNEDDFPPSLNKPDDTIYAGIDLKTHLKRMKEMEETGFFTRNFMANYDKITLSVDKAVRSQALIWKVGELPSFGNDANPWCSCQDNTDTYLDKIWIMNLTFKNDTASYNWSWGDGLVYHIKTIKENDSWKIDYMEGFDYDSFKLSFVYTGNIEGSWENNLVRIDIGDEFLTLWYHGLCVYFYPIRKINKQTVEMIWARDMDCKFDNGTSQTFGLRKVPVNGQPFARFTLRNDVLYADYYLKEWVRRYAKQVQEDVFTPIYSRRHKTY